MENNRVSGNLSRMQLSWTHLVPTVPHCVHLSVSGRGERKPLEGMLHLKRKRLCNFTKLMQQRNIGVRSHRGQSTSRLLAHTERRLASSLSPYIRGSECALSNTVPEPPRMQKRFLQNYLLPVDPSIHFSPCSEKGSKTSLTFHRVIWNLWNSVPVYFTGR